MPCRVRTFVVVEVGRLRRGGGASVTWAGCLVRSCARPFANRCVCLRLMLQGCVADGQMNSRIIQVHAVSGSLERVKTPLIYCRCIPWVQASGCSGKLATTQAAHYSAVVESTASTMSLGGARCVGHQAVAWGMWQGAACRSLRTLGGLTDYLCRRFARRPEGLYRNTGECSCLRLPHTDFPALPRQTLAASPRPLVLQIAAHTSAVSVRTAHQGHPRQVPLNMPAPRYRYPQV